MKKTFQVLNDMVRDGIIDNYAIRTKDFARIELFLSQDAVDRDVLLETIKRHGLELKWQSFESRYT